MLLKTAYWNSSTSSHSALTTEPKFLSCVIDHQVNQSAMATIILADADGSTARKYDVAANSVYVGPGQCQIWHPDDVCLFDGRILKARHDSESHRVILLCQDWLSQIGEHRGHYDMREDLDDSGLRQSVVHSDPDGADATSKRPAYTSGSDYYMFDDNMDWGIDKWNNKYLVFMAGMAGNIKVSSGPYDEIVVRALVTDSPVDGEENVWDDDSSYHEMADDTSGGTGMGWYTDYYFRMLVSDSDFYEANSISGARVHITYSFLPTTDTDNSVEFYDQTTHHVIGKLLTDGEIHKTTFQVPGKYLTDAQVFTNGISRIRIGIGTSINGETRNLKIYQIKFEVDVNTTGSSTAIGITDTISNRLKVDTDLVAAAHKIWETQPYAIVDKAYTHVDGLVTGGDSGKTSEIDPLMALSTNVEETLGIVTRHYSERTRLEILQDFAKMDSSVFWAKLGTTEIFYKATFLGLPLDGALSLDFPSLTDETDEGSNATPNDMTLLPAVAAQYDGYYFGFKDKESSMSLNVGIAGVGTYTGSWSYSFSQDNWIQLTVTDNTNEFKTAGTNTISWTPPSGWGTSDYGGKTGLYWIKYQLGATVGMTTQPKGTQVGVTPLTITDTDVLHWSSGEYDYLPMKNEFHVYGVRIGDTQIYVDTDDANDFPTDPGQDSKDKFGVSKSSAIMGSGVMSRYEAKNLASTLVETNEDVNLFLCAIIKGVSTLRLGDAITVTSTYLGLTDADYVVTHWNFSSSVWRTTIRLHPKTTLGYVDHITYGEHIRQINENTKKLQLDTVTPDLYKQIW